ncbi:hypothetical protein AB4072_13760 [Microvirga sp. 2MCAF38]|uniref:hypothetical protein n=1 Tax=Microvirga sp. 2MCAF38 TaxID=3232989 RepID=UPI003F9B2C4F
MAAKTLSETFVWSGKTWAFEAGDLVPEWLMRQVNCVLRFDRDALVVESEAGFELYPMSSMQADDTLILAEIVDIRMDSEVEHVLPITTHITPRKISLN